MQPSSESLPIRFVGSGSEYFRIWIVNLLLTLVTLGLYYPFAKARRLRYFHGATEIGGRPLSFHGDPWKMLRGYLLVSLMFGAYALATRWSPVAGLVALVVLAVVWPALWHSSMVFRLANTGWRGLRFRFTGRRGGAYGVMLWPVLAAIVLTALGAALAPEPAADGQPSLLAAVPALLPLFIVLLVPAFLWRLRRYQHSHYALGDEVTRFDVPMRRFYGVFAKAVLVAMAAGAAVAAVGFAIGVVFGFVGGGQPSPGAMVVFIALMALLGYVTGLVVVGGYLGARLQDLVWNGTRSQHLSFDSRLSARRLIAMQLRNWILIVLTLGLYFPFAAVAVARLRLQAVSVTSSLDPNLLVAVNARLNESAAGDAAGDVFGLDIGL